MLAKRSLANTEVSVAMRTLPRSLPFRTIATMPVHAKMRSSQTESPTQSRLNRKNLAHETSIRYTRRANLRQKSSLPQ